MSQRINLADPDFEPSDEQIREFMARASADVAARRAAADERLRTQIAAARTEALVAFQKFLERGRTTP